VTASVAQRIAVTDRTGERSISIPAVLYAVVIASTCIVVGLIWDISWHRTVGRDTFWTLAHVLEQVAAIIAGISCGWLVLRTSFGGAPDARAQSVRFWRYFQAPLGAWVCIWGTMMMITSAPFDNWWHNAYGLDVRIISPPHMILAGGMIGIQLGAMLMTVSAQNRAAAAADERTYAMMYAYAAGIVLTMIATVVQEDASVANEMHRAAFYRIAGTVFPIVLFGFARACRLKWPATTMAAVYSAILLAMMWILQLFAATPKLAPIYNPVTHMVPPAFPLLLVVPAYFGDILMRKFGRGRDWTLSVVLGVMFVLVMVAVHWLWADFMISPGARNFFFGADQWAYTDRLGPWRYRFWGMDNVSPGHWSAALFARGLGIASVEAIVSTRIGLWLGNGISRVKR
jgi:hypothetical protein